MNAKTLRVLIIIVVGVMLASGCREIETTTKIFPDGSCERTVAVNEDSTELVNCFFPIPRDSSWMFTQENSDEYIAMKKFKKVSDLNEELLPPNDTTLQVIIQVKLDKRFRWFHTLFTYRETYKDYNPFRRVPISDYLSEEDLALFYINDDTLDIENKTDAWSTETIFQELYQALLQGAKDIDDPELTPEQIQSKKESLFNNIMDLDYEEREVDKVLQACEESLKNPSVWKLKPKMTKVTDELKRKQDLMFETHFTDFTNSVIMPGLIIDTNAETIEGNKVTWDIAGRHFLWRDYEMWVESRVVNVWAIGVSVLVFLFMAVLMVMASLWKRRG